MLPPSLFTLSLIVVWFENFYKPQPRNVVEISQIARASVGWRPSGLQAGVSGQALSLKDQDSSARCRSGNHQSGWATEVVIPARPFTLDNLFYQ